MQGDSREVVAVKVVAKKTLNKASTENLLTEIEILKSVRHPHIVQLKDFQVRTQQLPGSNCLSWFWRQICGCWISSVLECLPSSFLSGMLKTFI